MNNFLYIDDLLESVDEQNTRIIIDFLNDNIEKLGYDQIVIFSHLKIESDNARLMLIDKTSSDDIPSSGEVFTHKAAFQTLKTYVDEPWWHVINITYRVFSRDAYKISKITSSKRRNYLYQNDFIGQQMFDCTSKFLHKSIITTYDFNLFNYSRKFLLSKINHSINSVEFCNLMIRTIDELTKSKGHGFSKKYLTRFWTAAKERIELEINGVSPENIPKRLNEIIHELDNWAWLSSSVEDYKTELEKRKAAITAIKRRK